MLWTMKQAKKRLEPFAKGGAQSLQEDIVTAMEALADAGYWEHLRQVIKFTVSGGGRFALPQRFETIVRAAVNGTPVQVRGVEYNFLYGGPGDLDNLPQGYAPMYGLISEGQRPPLVVFPAATARVVASLDDYSGDSVLTLVFNDGTRATVPIVATADLDAGWEAVAAPEITTATGGVSRLLVDDEELPQGRWLSLWFGTEEEAISDCYAGQISTSVKTPMFHYYRLPSACAEGQYTVLAEVKPALLRAYGEDDVLPFPSLQPIQYEMQAQTLFNNGEADGGMKFHQLAIGAMAAKDDSAVRRQSGITFNTPYELSAGEDSQHYVNI